MGDVTQHTADYRREWKRRKRRDLAWVRARNDARNARRSQIKTELFTKLGGKCVDCGHTRFTSLHVDHIDSSRRQGPGGHHTYLKLLGCPNGVELRCANCNLRRALERGEIVKDERGFDLRVEAIRLYGGKCSLCSENDEQVLCFDHVGGGGTAKRKSNADRHIGRRMHEFLIRERPADRRLLCANCNYDQHFGAAHG